MSEIEAAQRKVPDLDSTTPRMGHLLALKITEANERERAQVADLARDVQSLTADAVKVAYVDQGYTGAEPAPAVKIPRSSSPRAES